MITHPFKLGRLLCTLIFLVLSINISAQNPIRIYYGNKGYPTWTDYLKWGNQINMSTFSVGNTNFEKFEAARDILHAQGGGIMYYPSGTYDFSDMPANGPHGRGLMLKSGVIIMGDAPTTNNYAPNGPMALGTKFIFGFDTAGIDTATSTYNLHPRDWNIIGLMPNPGQGVKDVNNVGICWVELNGATVYFGPQVNWGPTYATSDSWYKNLVKDEWDTVAPRGLHPIDPFAGGGKTYQGVGTGRIVFGCNMLNAAVHNSALDYGFGPNGFHSYKFGPRIAIYGKNVFIANNHIPKATRNFKYWQKTCNTKQSSGCSKVCEGTPIKKVLYDYGKNGGIDVNKELLGWVINTDAGYFEPNVVVIDNYVYNHGHKGFNIAGNWIVLRNNNNVRDYLGEGDNVYGLGTGWELTLDGYIQSTPGGPGCISDNLSRAYDLSGRNMWGHRNKYNNLGSNPGNDGEGMLCQSHGGTQWYSWALTYNRHLSPYGSAGYIGGYDIDQLGSLIAWNYTPGWVGNTKAGLIKDAAYVSNTAGSGVKTTDTSDVLKTCPTTLPNAPINLTVTPDSVSVTIDWTDNSTDEIGFKIERRVGLSGNWDTVAYRPRRSFGSPDNPSKWIDFMAPRGEQLYYRVSALSCADPSTQAVVTSSPIVINELVTATRKPNLLNTIELFPNPVPQGSTFGLNNLPNNAQIFIFDVTGKMIYKTEILNQPYYEFPAHIVSSKNQLYLVKVESATEFRTLKVIFE